MVLPYDLSVCIDGEVGVESVSTAAELIFDAIVVRITTHSGRINAAQLIESILVNKESWMRRAPSVSLEVIVDLLAGRSIHYYVVDYGYLRF